MGILSSLLPGVRELRAPLSAGILWLGILVILFGPHRAELLTKSSSAIALQEIFAQWSSAIVLPATLGASYILGNVAVGLLNPCLRLAGKVIHKAINYIAGFRYKMLDRRQADGSLRRARRPRLFYAFMMRLESWTRPMSISARGLAIDAIQSNLNKVGVPGGYSYIFPIESAIESMRHSAAQLSQEASPQYQEYDRVRAESELRLAVTPPIVALGFLAPLNGKVWIAAAGLMIGSILLVQAVNQIRAANEILARAVYFGHASIPLVQSVAEYLSSLDPRPEEDGEWMGAIIVGLNHGGRYEELEASMQELLEFNDYDRSAAREYLGKNDPDAAAQFDRMMKRRIPPPWERDASDEDDPPESLEDVVP